MSNQTNAQLSALQRLLSLLFVFTLFLGLLPAGEAFAADKQYGRVNTNEVRFRRKAESTDVWSMLNSGWVVEILSTKRSGGVTYDYVVTNIPKHTDRQYWGYIDQKYITVMTSEEVTAWENAGGNAALLGNVTPSTQAPKSSTDAPVVLSGYAQPTSASVNYYSYNGSQLSSLGLLDQSSAYPVKGTATVAGTAYYIITVGSSDCYAKSANMTLLSSGTSSSVTPTPVPSGNTGNTGNTGTPLGTVRVKLAGSTNMRSETRILTTNVVAKLKQGAELPYYYVVHNETNDHDWYYCYDATSGHYGFIVDYCLKVLSSSSTSTTVPTGGTVTPVPGMSSTVIGYVKITPKGKTNIRQATKVGSNNVVAQAEQGEVLPYYAISTVDKATWYYVYYAPKSVFGYLLGSCAEKTDSSSSSTNPTLPPSGSVTPVPDTSTIKGYIKFTAGGVNLRADASLSAKILGRFDKGQIIPYYGTKTNGKTTWYYVHKDDAVGYVSGDFCKTTDNAGNTVTPAPDGTVTQGYLMTTADKVYVRKQASTSAGTYGQVQKKGTVLPIVGASVTANSITWYRVQFEGNVGFIHGKFISVLNADQVNAYLNGDPMPTPTPTPTPAPKPVDYIQTIADKVWIRNSPSTSSGTKGQANLGAVFHFTGTTKVNGVLWYKIDFADGSYYIMGKYCKVMTDAEYNAYQNNQPTTKPTSTPRPEDMSNVALTNTTKVIVRAAGVANGKQLALLYKANQVCRLLGPTNVSGGKTWYNLTVNGVTGWIRGDLLRILTKTEAEMLEKTGDPNAKPEASYTTLQLGSTGAAVTKLQNRLVELGLLSSSNVTGTYDTTTREAVRTYQSQNGLTADGIAGSATQHSLYGTVETGYYDNNQGATGMTLYTPELIDWYTGGIQSIFYKGCVATVTDVKTGISFKVKRWSGGDHADVEPLTAADTAAMCRIYGVATAQAIADKDLYQRRPLLVTIGTHSYCASMYGEPHNYPDGDTIPDNNFNGQFCIHFVNSKLHGGTSGNNKKVDQDHQNAIMYAYNNAVSKLTAKGYVFK